MRLSVYICLCVYACIHVCVCMQWIVYIAFYPLADNTLLHLFGSWLFEATVWPDFWPAQG